MRNIVNLLQNFGREPLSPSPCSVHNVDITENNVNKIDFKMVKTSIQRCDFKKKSIVGKIPIELHFSWAKLILYTKYVPNFLLFNLLPSNETFYGKKVALHYLLVHARRP